MGCEDFLHSHQGRAFGTPAPGLSPVGAQKDAKWPTGKA